LFGVECSFVAYFFSYDFFLSSVSVNVPVAKHVQDSSKNLITLNRKTLQKLYYFIKFGFICDVT